MREPIKVVAEIIQRELGLPQGQVMLAYEKYDLPKTPGIFVALSYIGLKAIGVKNSMEDSTDGPSEVQEVVVRSMIQIDALSFDASARERKEEIFMALGSVLSQRLQEENNIQIGRIPTDFTNTASLEETKYLNRFTAQIGVTSLHRKSKLVPYFDQFNTPEVTVNG